MTNYQQAKKQLKNVSIQAKRDYKTDKPAIRQAINDTTYFLSIDLNLSEYKTNLLHEFASKLHPKN